MKKELYIQILNQILLPFIRDVYPESDCFMADNDPKHTSGAALDILDEMDVFWWQTPAQSPDLNPIENMWHELKEFLRREVKPTTKKELIDGIQEFWKT